MLSVFCWLAFASSVFAAFPATAPDNTFEAEAIATGAWQATSTWKNGHVPQAGDDVYIPNGYRVSVQALEDDGIRYLRVEGEFRLVNWTNTRLRVETIYVAPDAELRIGASGFPVGANLTAEVVFTSATSTRSSYPSWDPNELGGGLVSDGAIYLFGSPKTHMAAVNQDALAGTSSLSLATAPSGWKIGDELVVAGTYFRRTAAATSSRDEIRAVSSVSGSTVGLASGLSHDHVRVDPSFKFHVANLTRNLVFRSLNASPISGRGHVMLRNGTVEIENTAFVSLGRTDKTTPLDDLVVTQSSGSYDVAVASNPSNRRGRYSLHFHRNLDLTQSQPPASALSSVSGSVTRDSVGWGFVNHESYVDFSENVAYNFVGAGFVTEGGNELGSFDDNIAIRGTGDGTYDPIFRFVFNHPTRPQPLSDFAFRGHGFWFQGPAVSATDNVASGCDGAGMVWFTPGAPESAGNTFFTDPADGRQKNPYTHFPRSWVNTVYPGSPLSTINPRHWQRPGEPVNNTRLLIGDLPILEMNGFEAYGNYVGFRLRFNNDNVIDWFNDKDFDYQDFVVNPAGSTNHIQQQVASLDLWNNQQAFRMRYVEDTKWSNVTALNALDYDLSGRPTEGHAGAEFFFQIEDQVFDGVTIEGYPVAGQIRTASRDASGQFTMVSRSYADYANFDAWNPGTACGTPSSLMASTGSTSATLSWSSSADRHTLRYRPVGDQNWTILGPIASNSQFVSGLSSSTSYQFQVLGGCATFGLSNWSSVGSFTTP